MPGKRTRVEAKCQGNAGECRGMEGNTEECLGNAGEGQGNVWEWVEMPGECREI